VRLDETTALALMPADGGGLHPNGPTTVDTFTGLTIDLADPTPDAICERDIAHGMGAA
jgi:hypothetical protein